MTAPLLSVDDLIAELVASTRKATDEELAHIIAHVAAADFSRRLVRIDKRLAGLVYQGKTITGQTRLPSVEAHLLKRIYIEQQWLPGTTADEYLADAHAAVQHSDVEIWTYRWQGHVMAGFLSP